MSRPGLVDYFLILAGCGLSLLLVEWSGLQAAPPGEGAATAVWKILAYLLFLPQGMLLGWPLFFATQRLAGREQALSAGEWVWGVAWLGSVALVTWICWHYFGTLPEFLQPGSFKKTVVFVYVLYVLTLAGIAAVIVLIDLVGRWPQPWTHSFGLALLIWPILPLAGLWLGNVKLE